MKRRTFLINSGLASTGLILKPRLIDKVMNFIEKRGEPLLEYPKEYENTLYAHKWDNAGKYYLSLGMNYDVGQPWYSEGLCLKSDDEIFEDFNEKYDFTTFRTYGEGLYPFKEIRDIFSQYYFPELKDIDYKFPLDFNSLEEWNKLSDEEKSDYIVYLDDPISEEDKNWLLQELFECAQNDHDIDILYEVVDAAGCATDFFWEFQNKYKKLNVPNKQDIFALISIKDSEYGLQETGGMGGGVTYQPGDLTICDGLQSISILQHELNRLNWNTKIEMV